MKIVSITTIKNEADIIESFIRYHLNIVDEMIILNNGSTDDTNYILNNLLSEGLPLIILNDADKYFEPMEKYNCLLKKAVNEYHADIICPLDVDEFITCPTGNPRDIIENIPPFTFYKIKWKTYIPSKMDKMENKFIPSKITHVRDERIETFYKVILTRDLSYHYNVRLTTGNHNLQYEKRFENDIHCEECNQLRIAHFPLRSIEQMTSKVLVSYPNTLSRKNVNPNMSHHYPLMFNKIIEKGFLEIEDVSEFAKQYSLEENKGKKELDYKDIQIINDPMNLDFCKDTKIHYDFKINPLNNVLNNYVYFANEIHKFKNDAKTAEEEFAKKYDELLYEKNEIENKFKKSVIKLGDKDNEIRHLDEKINLLATDHPHFKEDIGIGESNFNKNINELINEKKRLENKLNHIYDELNNKDKEIKFLNDKIKEMKNDAANENNIQINDLNEKLVSLTILLDKQKYANNFYSKQLKNLKVENEFIKTNSKFQNLIPYLYLLFKSKPSELIINWKLFKYFKRFDFFDIGYYLNKNSDSVNYKLGRFSPELHYICFGFNQKKRFNDKVPIFNDKYELLNYLKKK